MVEGQEASLADSEVVEEPSAMTSTSKPLGSNLQKYVVFCAIVRA